MKTVGIICEYNPFHNGHIYQINKIKEFFPDCLIVVVLSGNYMQRGELSIIDKWDKTKIALNYVDLVIELPFVFASQSADIFAHGAISILNELKVDYLVFGTDELNVQDFNTIVDIQKIPDFNKNVTALLSDGYNYPTALAQSVYKLCQIKISKPNDLLGLSYMKELEKLNSDIKPINIPRSNDYHSTELINNISSGTAIRKGIKNKINISEYVPDITLTYLSHMHFLEDYFELLKYKIISTDISNIQTVDEGIENRIKKYIMQSSSLNELVSFVKTKRFTYNKIMRMLIHILTNFTKDEAKKTKNIEYIRILGFDQKGKNYLNKIKKDTTVPIISKFNKQFKMLDIESRVSNIYYYKDNAKLEYKQKPIIK